MMTSTTKKSNDTEPCFSCSGSGKIKIECFYLGGKIVENQITCYICNGSGLLALGDGVKKKEAAKEFWCTCDKADFGDCHNDDECLACFKHHVHCKNCGKVMQLG